MPCERCAKLVSRRYGIAVHSTPKGKLMVCCECRSKHLEWVEWMNYHNFDPTKATRVPEYKPARPSILDLLIWGERSHKPAIKLVHYIIETGEILVE